MSLDWQYSQIIARTREGSYLHPTVKLNRATDVAVTVSVEVAEDPAYSEDGIPGFQPADYRLPTSTVTIPAGQMSTRFILSIAHDAEYEGDRVRRSALESD